MTEGDTPQTFQTEGEPDPDANRRTEAEPQTQEVADAAGEAVVGETATKIPVAYEDTLKGPAGDNDLTTQQYRKENWIPEDQKDKAETMAYVEDGATTRAAIGDRAASSLGVLPGKLAELQQTHDELGPAPEVTAKWGSKKQEQKEARWDHLGAINNLNDQAKSLTSETEKALDATLGAGFSYNSSAVENAVDSSTNPRAKETHDSLVESISAGAQQYRKKAEELGELAGTLYDHPPSEAFLKGNSSSFDFADPYDLYYIERAGIEEVGADAAKMTAEARKMGENGPATLEEAQEVIDNALEFFGIDSLTENAEDVTSLFQSEVRPLVQETVKLIKTAYDNDMTVEQIRRRATEITRNCAIISEGQAIGLERALNDVKSGKAADSEYKAPEIPTEQIRAALSSAVTRNRREAEKWHAIAQERTGKERDKAIAIASLHAQKADEAYESLSAAPAVSDTPETAPVTEPAQAAE